MTAGIFKIKAQPLRSSVADMAGSAKDWCFTLNNYSDEEYEALLAKYEDQASQIRYIVIGKEVGANGTPH